MRSRRVALAVAGFDPSSGAGVTADLKVFAAHGLFGVSVVTALTVQSTQGVRRVEAVSGRLVRESLDCLAEDVELSGIKIGMLGSAEVVAALAGFLREARVPRESVVLDPVLRSSSGRELLEASGVQILRDDLLPVVGWVTPNVDELGILGGFDRVDADSVPAAADRLASLASGLNVVVTGGHLERPDDFLLTSGGLKHWFHGERVETTSTHGTGCAFSSALLCRLILGDGPGEAVAAAKSYVAGALRAAYPVGKGRGPLHHLYKVERTG
jgi:hydroxymethylpyrimidine/phosphomethylpyrimidine kinase